MNLARALHSEFIPYSPLGHLITLFAIFGERSFYQNRFPTLTTAALGC